MIQPKRAPVRPRVVCPASGEALPLEDEVRRLLDCGAGQVVALVGEAGAGKSTALQHLAAVLPPEAGVLLLDECAKIGILPTDKLSIIAVKGVQRDVPQVAYRLAPWGDDDLIEYLLAVHQKHCGSVMARLRPNDRALCQGLPELWRIVLDQMACDPTIPDARSALRRELAGRLVDPGLLRQTRIRCLGSLVVLHRGDAAVLEQIVPPDVRNILRHRPVQLLLAGDLIADDLRGDGDVSYLTHRLPREIVAAVAAAIAGESRCHDRLLDLLAGPSENHAMAASILHAASDPWRPAADRVPMLCGAYLHGVVWPGVVLAHADLEEADFTAADLRDADLRGAKARRISLGRAQLGLAVLEQIAAAEANLAGADLFEVRAGGACFRSANLEGANLEAAVLWSASFIAANLTGTVLRDADLEKADLTGAKIDEADFTGAFLEGARLSGLRLRDAIWTGASFGAAQMAGCDLEGLELPGVCFEDANLEGALLTGCVMPGANFDNACLKSAGLGDVDWEGASLREADLRGATFHMGSSRSGLVGSPIASEGSRTGFYTDDYEEQYYKAPEEIRKANLCRADLRGALIDGVDFYLVDLRGARYDAEHEDHFRRCGAILKARVEE
jgi:uncharacterized protein YjbI with pentapeptide repeats